MEIVEWAARAVLDDLRDRKLLKYLFADDPENRGAYGYIESPIDAGTQQEIAAALATAVLQAIREPSEEMIQAACDATFGPQPMTPAEHHLAGWQAMIAAALLPDPPSKGIEQ